MSPGRGKNRRRNDAAERVKAARSFASRLFSVTAKLCAVAALAAAVYFGGTYGYRWATTSPTFALKSVSVTGTKRSDGPELAKLAGLSKGQNLFKMDVAQIRRAMEQHPWVRRVELTRHFPSAVSLEVEEHEPVALVALGELYLLDDRGEPFKKLTAGDSVDLPLVTGIGRDAYIEKPEAAAERFRRSLEAIAAFDEAHGKTDASEKVSEVRIDDDGITVVTQQGVEVRLGDDVSSEKLARLARVRAELRRRGLSAEVIHLDNRVRPGWVTVKISSALSERKRDSKQ